MGDGGHDKREAVPSIPLTGLFVRLDIGVFISHFLLFLLFFVLSDIPKRLQGKVDRQVANTSEPCARNHPS